ncbi:cation diffusion facilitator family transporter [Rubricella aquisinus]|uniref:Cation diffusion facilitator family transporter n=1 Tax=Rubricella aquisinus TaxID=2028108 RepID=A0A840WJ33_9RHOB|nr:cation diffusion facilitator family transporter [Rubricella aquisinus]MBB5514213.1 cation diffusion facilitator family transporter [Rubricella aquisinus]
MQHRSQKITRTAQISILIGVAVLCIKLSAYVATGSVAVLSDALESVVNVLAALLALFAVRVAQRPADANHPHGHEKAEYLAAIVEGALVLAAAILILREAIVALLNPAPVSLPPIGMAALVLATILNLVWARVLIRRGTTLRSPALKADGHHLNTDVITTIGVVAGLGLAIATGWYWIDPVLAIAVSIHVLASGYRMVRSSLAGLMDETVDAGSLEEIEQVVAQHLGPALEAHDLKVRPLGRGLAVEMHLVVPGRMSVQDAHVICDRIEDALAPLVHGGDVLIHIEPAPHAKGADTMLFQG